MVAAQRRPTAKPDAAGRKAAGNSERKRAATKADMGSDAGLRSGGAPDADPKPLDPPARPMEQSFQLVDVEEVANALKRAYRDKVHGRGRAVFLIGAGCSVSAGIPAAAGTAKHAAIWLAGIYSRRSETFKDKLKRNTDAELDRVAAAALEWLLDNSVLRPEFVPRHPDGQVAWGGLYNPLFERHIVSPNEQRDFITYLVRLAQGRDGQVRLNWAHACLGELVGLGYVHTVLTTNFDQLALSAIIRSAGLPVVADGTSSYNRILPQPPTPQLVHLHGSMHTYELANTTRAIDETDAPPAYSMIHHLLQQSQVLVVVGHSGTDAGIMRMLLKEAQDMAGIVVYWVVRSLEHPLHENVRRLLKLENKFLVDGGEADRFFGDLMSLLDASPPRWVKDPIGELGKQRGLLVPPKDDIDVKTIIAAFEQRVDYAVRQGRDPEQADPLTTAAELRSAGRFGLAREALSHASGSAPDRNQASRLDALSALELFEISGGRDRSKLIEAIEGFEALVEATKGTDRFENVSSLLDALVDLNEADNSGAGERDSSALDRIIAIVNANIRHYRGQPARYAALLQARADAVQQKADGGGDGPLTEEALRQYERAYADYLAAERHLQSAGGASDQLSDVREGLAGVLQVLGSRGAAPDLAKIDEAIRLFTLLASRPSLNASPGQEGGLAYNLGCAWLELWIAADGARGQAPYANAEIQLERARRAFVAANDAPRLKETNRQIERMRSTAPPTFMSDGGAPT